jgi:hypothetical protein
LHASFAPQGDVPSVHSSMSSLHVSSPLHAMPSLQLLAVPAHVTPPQTSLTVQYASSSQVAPSLPDQAVVEREGSQT